MEVSSIAMIETNGLVTSITALEAMLKLGDIKFLKKEIISNGQVTIFISGDAPHLKRVLQAGEIAAKNVGIVISSSLVENPTNEILDLILERKKETSKARRSKKKPAEVEAEKIDTLFDNVMEDAIVEESTKVISEDKIIVEEAKPNISENDLSEVELDNSEDENAAEIEVEENISAPIVETLSDQNIEVIEDEVNENVELEEVVAEKSEFESMSHLERLRAEAKLEIEEDIKNELDVEDTSIEKDEEIVEVNTTLPEETISSSNKSELVVEESTVNSNSKEDHSEYSTMNVPQLRKLARSNPDFPIKGRDISKANRKVLLDYFNQIS